MSKKINPKVNQSNQKNANKGTSETNRKTKYRAIKANKKIQLGNEQRKNNEPPNKKYSTFGR